MCHFAMGLTHCYKTTVFFTFISYNYGRPPYAPAQVNGGSRNFCTWWTLSANREVTTCIFSWSSLNYRVGQKVTKFGIFSDPARNLSALTPECDKKIVTLRKNLLSTYGCSTRVPSLVNFGLQTPEIHASYHKICRNLRISVYISGMAERRFPKVLHVIDGTR